jgi:hypothetical protein
VPCWKEIETQEMTGLKKSEQVSRNGITVKRILPIFMISLIFATSCRARQETACMEPVVNFDYQVNNFESVNLLQENVLPSEGWQKQNSNDQNIESIELVQQEDGRDFIWVSAYSKENNSSSLLRFQPDNGIWQPVKSDDLSLGNFSLVKDSNGVVWYIRKNWTDLKIAGAGSLFDIDASMIAFYENNSHQFQTALKVRDLVGQQELDSIKSLYVTDAKLDSENNIWFILDLQMKPKKEEYRLLQFSPSTGKIEQKLTDVSINWPAAPIITSDDNLYLVNAKDELLIRYNLRKDVHESIDIPTGILEDGQPGTINLFLGGNNTLWLSDYGWADISSPQFTWHKIIRSPGFIHQQMGNGIITWAHPHFLMESEDQRLWYTSGRGTGWVDPDTGQWCVFTTYPSNIVEDSDHNLWMSAAGNLYKYDLEE